MISNNILFLLMIFFTEAKILEISYTARQEKIDHTEIIQANDNKNNNNKCTESNHYHKNITKQLLQYNKRLLSFEYIN